MPDTSEVTIALLGAERKRSIQAVGGALVLLQSVSALIALDESREWMAMFAGRIHLVVLFVLVAGGGLAAGNAYWNSGLLLSWLLVFGLVFGWLWNTFVQAGTVFFHEAIIPVLWAVFAAVVVGTVGYAIGRSLRGSSIDEMEDDPSNWLLRVLLGVDHQQLVRWSLLAGGLFVTSASLIYVTHQFYPLPVEGVTLFEVFFAIGALNTNFLLGIVVVLGWLGLAMVPASRSAGLLVSWVLIFGPLFGASMTDWVLEGISGSGPLVDATFALVFALVFALILGTIGFLIGRGARLAFERRRSSGTQEQGLV